MQTHTDRQITRYPPSSSSLPNHTTFKISFQNCFQTPLLGKTRFPPVFFHSLKAGVEDLVKKRVLESCCGFHCKVNSPGLLFKADQTRATLLVIVELPGFRMELAGCPGTLRFSFRSSCAHNTRQMLSGIVSLLT